MLRAALSSALLTAALLAGAAAAAAAPPSTASAAVLPGASAPEGGALSPGEGRGGVAPPVLPLSQPAHALPARELGWGAASAVAATMGMLAALLATRARQPALGWFAAAGAFWAGYAGLQATGLPPIPAAWFHALSSSLFLAALLMCCVRLAPRRAGARTWPWLLPGLSVLVAAGHWMFFGLPAARALHLLLVFAAVPAGALALARLEPRGQAGPAGLFLAAGVAALVGLSEGARHLLHGLDPGPWPPYAGLLPMLVLAGGWADEQVRLLQRLRRLAGRQQGRLDARMRGLRQAFERRSAEERRQAALEERNRILREMHDGLGGRLVGALALARQLEARQAPQALELMGELRRTLDDCLLELRLALDSMEGEACSLGEALAELRFRVEPSLRAAGVRLVWDVQDEAMALELPGADTLHVLRIVREALTNVIKHARASTVRLTLQRQAQEVVLCVQDNGGGSALSTGGLKGLPSGGRGLANMQQRAQALGARLVSGRQAEGWAVTLRLPLVQGDRLRAAA